MDRFGVFGVVVLARVTGSLSTSGGVGTRMADLCEYAGRPLAFILRYVRCRPIAHTAILTAVLTAVACSVGTQYGVKFLVDVLSNHNGAGVWIAFGLLGSLITADNLLWRLAGWIANYTFVGVTGDLRRDLFRHLTGHSQSYFAERMPGTLTSRVVRHFDEGFAVRFIERQSRDTVELSLADLDA